MLSLAKVGLDVFGWGPIVGYVDEIRVLLEAVPITYLVVESNGEGEEVYTFLSLLKFWVAGQIATDNCLIDAHGVTFLIVIISRVDLSWGVVL